MPNIMKNYSNLYAINYNYSADNELIPVNRVQGCTLDEMETKSIYVKLPQITLNATYYTEYEGKLCQMRIESVTIKRESDYFTTIISGVVAYDGKIKYYEQKLVRFQSDLKIYSSITDFENNRPIKVANMPLYFLFGKLTEGVYNIGINDGGCCFKSFYYIWRWEWNGAKPIASKTDLYNKFSNVVTIKENEILVGDKKENFDTLLQNVIHNTWKTEVECKNANTINLCTFDDCKPEEEKEETEVVHLVVTKEQHKKLMEMGFDEVFE